MYQAIPSSAGNRAKYMYMLVLACSRIENWIVMLLHTCRVVSFVRDINFIQ